MFKTYLCCLFLSLSLVKITAQSPTNLAPDFNFIDDNGIEHNLYHALDQGFVVLLDFFYADCGPCQASAPEIQKIYEDFEGKNVLVFSLSDRDDNSKIKNFKSTNQLNFITGGIEGGGDEIIQLYSNHFEFIGFPTVSVICQDGFINWDIFPYSTGAPEWRDAIEACGVQDSEPYMPINSEPTSLSDNQLNIKEISINPNPTNNQSNLNIHLEEASNLTVKIYNSIGECLQIGFQNLLPKGNHSIPISFENLPKGTYFLKIQTEQKKVTLLPIVRVF